MLNYVEKKQPGWAQFGRKKFKDFSRTFNSLLKTYSVNVLPSYVVFSDGDFRDYAISYKTINSLKFV